MTPVAIYKAVRDGLIILAIAFVVWCIYTDGKNSVKATQLSELQHQITAQGKIIDAWHTESTNANIQLGKDVASINITPVVIHDWVRPYASLPSTVLPKAAGKTGNNNPPAGGVQPGHGTDVEGPRRDAVIAEFKKHWETEFAKWRAEDAQWPQ